MKRHAYNVKRHDYIVERNDYNVKRYNILLSGMIIQCQAAFCSRREIFYGLPALSTTASQPMISVC